MNNRTIIARGAFGVIYASKDSSTGEPVADKCVSDDKIFKRELRFMIMLKSVKGTMPIISYNESKRCIRMPLMPGSLRNLVQCHRPHLSHRRRVRLARWVARELLQALVEVHAHGVVHFDIKPDNIMVDWSHHLVLSDFGLAADAGVVIRRPLGTPTFMAPEVRRGDFFAHPSADMYSVGCTLAAIVLPEDLTRHTGLAELVNAMCHEQPTRRPRASDALMHPFLDSKKKVFCAFLHQRWSVSIASMISRSVRWYFSARPVTVDTRCSSMRILEMRYWTDRGARPSDVATRLTSRSCMYICIMCASSSVVQGFPCCGADARFTWFLRRMNSP